MNPSNDAIAKLHNVILMNLDSNRDVVLILLDLSVAFNTINIFSHDRDT